MHFCRNGAPLGCQSTHSKSRACAAESRGHLQKKGTRVIVDSTVLLLTCTSIIVASVLIVLVWFPARIDCWLWKEDGSVLTLVCDCDMLTVVGVAPWELGTLMSFSLSVTSLRPERCMAVRLSRDADA